jgi:hypothetical protein
MMREVTRVKNYRASVIKPLMRWINIHLVEYTASRKLPDMIRLPHL